MARNSILGLIGATGFSLLSMAVSFAGDESHPGAKCEVAVVNPVSGYAECVKPRGAPVDQPPPRPAPTPDECLKHPDLDLEACRPSQPKSRE
jgi:hypothetical protein